LSNDGINLAGIDRLDSAGTDCGSNDLDDIVYSAQITIHYYYLRMKKKKKNKNHRPSSRKMEAPRQNPTVPHQKQDVLLLLLAHQQTLQLTTKAGEAFFLLAWNWWCQWCRHVDFFYRSEKEAIAMATASTTIESQKESERIQQVLELLPRGAVLPTQNQKNYEDDDSSMDSETDTCTQRPPQGPQERLTRIASTAARQ
jgi:hypothetical protein